MSDRCLDGQSLRCVPYTLFILIRVKRAFILEDRDDSLLARLQLWFNSLKFRALQLPVDHPLLEFSHIAEELLSVIPHIVPLMPVHVYPLFQPCPPPPQLVQPASSCALRQPSIKHISEGWKDPLVKSLSEQHGGDVPCVQARKVRPCRSLDSLVIEQRMAAFASSFLRKELFESLVMACKCPDLTSKMGALPFVPLVRDVFACDNAFGTFEKEGGEIAKDNQLVYLGERRVSIF